MTVHVSWVHRVALLVAFGASVGCGEDAVSIGRGQCPSMPLYNARDIVLNGGTLEVAPDAVDPESAGKAITAFREDGRGGTPKCFTRLGGAVTDPADRPSGTGGTPSKPEPDAGGLTPDSGATDAS
jgi:hypothetical protein